MGFVQGTGDEIDGTDTSLAVAFDSDVTEGNLIVVSFAEYSTAPTVENISDSRGNTWALKVQEYDDHAGEITVFTCIAKDSGPMTVTVTYGTNQYMAMAISEFSGYTQTVVDSSSANTEGTATTDVHAGSVTGAGLYIGTHTNTLTDTTITPDENWDGTVYNDNAGSNSPSMVLNYREVSSGTYDDGWTLAASRNWGAIGIIFEAAGGTTYNLTVTEGLSFSDGPSEIGDLAKLVGEGVTFADLVSEVAAFIRSVSEGAVFGDIVSQEYTPAPSADTYNLSVVEGLVMSDGVLENAVFDLVLTEALKLVDIPSESAVFNRLVSEGLKLSDLPYEEIPGTGRNNWRRLIRRAISSSRRRI